MWCSCKNWQNIYSTIVAVYQGSVVLLEWRAGWSCWEMGGCDDHARRVACKERQVLMRGRMFGYFLEMLWFTCFQLNHSTAAKGHNISKSIVVHVSFTLADCCDTIQYDWGINPLCIILSVQGVGEEVGSSQGTCEHSSIGVVPAISTTMSFPWQEFLWEISLWKLLHTFYNHQSHRNRDTFSKNSEQSVLRFFPKGLVLSVSNCFCFLTHPFPSLVRSLSNT